MYAHRFWQINKAKKPSQVKSSDFLVFYILYSRGADFIPYSIILVVLVVVPVHAHAKIF